MTVERTSVGGKRKIPEINSIKWNLIPMQIISPEEGIIGLGFSCIAL